MRAAGFAAVSDARGSYHLLGLPSGEYVLTVEAPGFRPYRQSGLLVGPVGRVILDVRLEVGGPGAAAIEVTARGGLLETGGGQVGFTVDQSQVLATPLDGRNFISLLALSPGVALPARSLLPRINGSRPRTNEYLTDGISVLQPEPGQVAIYPVPDAIEELRLNVNSYSAEYGRSNGGTVMVATRPGGNELHGSLFEYFRNETLNARNYFARPGAKPRFRRNQYGFAAGGPVQKNRTFLFADWQGTRLRTGVTRFSTVPSPGQRAGAFPTPVYDPQTSPRAPFPNNTIPEARFDPVARRVLERYPLPNLAGAANNYVRSGDDADAQEQFDLRIDRHFGTRSRVFARYSWFRDEDNPVTPLPDGSGAISSGVTGHAITRAGALAAAFDWNFSASSLNQVRFGHTLRSVRQSALENGGISVPGIPAASFGSVLPLFSVAGYQQIGPPVAANLRFATSVTELQDTASLVRGAAILKFGLDLRRQAMEVLNPPNPAGSFSFSLTGTNAPGLSGSGNAVASLILGQVNAFSLDLQPEALQPRAHIAEFFAAAEWKLAPRLTLNIGTRYTLNFPSTEARNRGAVFNLRTRMLEFTRTARDLECCDFGPRVGIAWRGGANWVLRSGYGMIWFEQSGITTPFTLPQFPFVQTVSRQSQDNLNAAFVLAEGPSVQPLAPGPDAGLGLGVFGSDRHSGSGYSQQWNLTLQRTVGANLNLEAGYLGSKNTRLGVPDVNLNQLPPSYLALGDALLERVPNPFVGQIPSWSTLGGPTLAAHQLLRTWPRFTSVALFRNNVGSSSYHALQAKAERRISRGLTFTLAYTWSKLLDDASSVFSNTIFTGPLINYPVADSFNRRLEKDRSNGDIPHVFSAGWVYRIPRFWKVSGWEVAGIVRVQSGGTVAVTQAANLNSSLGFGTQRPNRIADPNALPNRNAAGWFATNAFTLAPQFTIGNSSRNPVRGPGLQNADLMLGKTFRLNERFLLEVRAEAFNVANTPPLNDPDGSFGSAAFGSITAAGNPRVFEAVGRIRF